MANNKTAEGNPSAVFATQLSLLKKSNTHEKNRRVPPPLYATNLHFRRMVATLDEKTADG